MVDWATVPNTEIVYEVLNSVLESVNAVYEQEDVVLPDRQYVMFGEASHDCDQLTVSFEQLYIGGPGDQAESPQQCNAPRTVVMTVQLVRSIPTMTTRGSPPTAEAIDETSKRLSTDTWLLLEGCMASSAVHAFGALADVSVTPASGGYQATICNMSVGVP